MNFETPPPMDPGDKVAVIAPSSGGASNARHVFELGLERLEAVFGLEPVVFPTARQSDEFLAATPRARAADIHTAFKDPDIGGVIATIGGWEQLRVLKHLDSDVLRENPTRFYGMSDNTNLNLALWNAGLVSFNGAQLMNEIAVPGELPPYTERYCRTVFFEESFGSLVAAEEWTDEPSTWWTNPDEMGSTPEYEPNPGWEWHGGTDPATGRLWGGNRSIVEWQLATDRYVPDRETVSGDVLALEVSETLPDPQTVAGTLLCLGERGLLEAFDGVLLGRVPGRSYVEEPPAEQREQYRRAVREVVAQEVQRYNPSAPVVCGLDWGHTNPVAPLPVGGLVEIEPAAQKVTLEM